jgi:hypothetical protein
MIYQSSRRHVIAAVGAFLTIALILSGIWLLVRDSDTGGGTAQEPAAPPVATSTPAEPEPVTPAPSTSSATMTVTVYFHRGTDADPARVVAVRRTVPRTVRVADASLRQLLAGPTASERRAGYWSHFSAATAGMLRGVRIDGGVAYADFRDLRATIPNASSSAGSTALLAELDGTLRQFASVRATVYSINGDVPLFYAWLQREPPAGTTPTLGEARRVAREFLVRVAGMDSPAFVASRWRSDYIATVDFRSTVGERPSWSGGPVTRVVLGKGRTTFTVLDTATETIRVDRPQSAISPSDLERVTSPVTVTGAALAFEGTVTVRVVQLSGTTVRQLGTGFVTGGGDVLRPFTGSVTFAGADAGTGWVLAAERSALDGSTTKVTAVRVAFG